MKNKTALTAIGLGIAAVVAYYYKTMTTTLKNLSVSIFGVKFDSKKTVSSAFLKIWFDLTLKVDNPTNRPITISEVLLTFKFNNNVVGDVKNFDRIKIPEKRATNVTVKTYVETLGIYKLIDELLKDLKNKKPLTINVTGTVNLEGNKVFINQDIRLL